MEDFVRKTRGVRDITSLPLDTSHELDIVSDVKGKIYIKILNRYKELLFDNGTEQWVIDMLNNLEVDVEQLKEDVLDVEQALTELPIIEDKLVTVETTIAQINTLFAQMQIDVQGLDLRTAELEREVVQLALKDQELLDKINNLDVDLDFLYSNSDEFGEYDYSGNPNLSAKLNASSFSSGTGATVTDDGDEIVFTLDGTDRLLKYTLGAQNPVTKGKQYTISCEIMLETGFTGDPSGICLQHAFMPGGVAVLQTDTVPKNELNTWQKLIGTKTIEYNSETVTPSGWYPIFRDIRSLKPSGKVRLRNIKIEEGSTATSYQPNLLDAPYYLSKVTLNDKIPYYKYVGINLEASKNPNDYEWIPLSKSAETVDARLSKTISTYDTVNALQNNRLTALESKVVDTTWQNVSVTEPFTSVTQPQVKKQNGIVYMRGTISNGTGDCFTLPEGFRPPAGAYEMQFRLPCRSADASDYATIYVRPSGLCSIAGVNGTNPIFLSGIIFSTT